MYRARHFRWIARQALKGFWALTIGITLVASLLGGTVVSSSGTSSGGFHFRFNVNLSQPSSSGLPLGQSREFSSAAAMRDLLESLVSSPFFISLMIFFGLIALVLLVIGGAVELGLKRYNLDLLTRENAPAFRTLFSRFSIWGKALGLRLMTGLLIFLWTLLLIIPGIIAAYRYALAPYLMAENPDMGIWEAIDRSKALMQGNKARLFWLQLSFIGWRLLSGLTLGVGALWLCPYMNAADAAFYLEVTGRANAMPQPELSPDP